MSTSTLNTLSKKNLEKLIAETEKSLLELKNELKHRQEEEQENEIAHLENHFKSAELSLKTINDFIAYLAETIRKK